MQGRELLASGPPLWFNLWHHKEAAIDTREIIAWTIAAGGVGSAALFIVLFLSRAREVRRLRAAKSSMGRDPLTKLLTRRSVLGILEAEVARCLRGDTSLGVLMVDIDHLATFNAEHGRDAGDTVLGEAAARVRNNIRIYDAAGRCDDEKFLVVLPDCDAKELNNIAERMRMTMERTPMNWKGRSLRVTVSIGGLTTMALDEKSADRLVRSAEVLVKEAKNLGRNRVQITDPFELTDESSLGLALETQRRRTDDGGEG